MEQVGRSRAFVIVPFYLDECQHNYSHVQHEQSNTAHPSAASSRTARAPLRGLRTLKVRKHGEVRVPPRMVGSKASKEATRRRVV